MKEIKKKLTTAIVTGSLLFTISSPAFADTNVHIGGNGSRSDNNVSVKSNHTTTIRQNNMANFSNDISLHSLTGGNRSNGNTGGNVKINSGSSDTSVSVENSANTNQINNELGSNNGQGGSGNGFSHFSKKLKADLTGSQEVPGPGDPNGSGKAKVKLSPNQSEVCVELHVKDIMPATAAHIHEAPRGSSGPVVIHLPTPNGDGYAKGCVSADSNEVMDILENPDHYYVNIHNSEYPNGAVRGQLSR